MPGVPAPRHHDHLRRTATLLGAVLLLLSLVLGEASLLFGAESTNGAPAVPGFRQADHVAILTIKGPIDQVTLASLERRLQDALDDGADAIVIELNTPGGEIGVMRDIVHLIRTECPGNTVAWINPTAYSAGTVIAIACREMVVNPDAAFGDAAPIHVDGMGIIPIPQAERDKLEAPLRAEAVESARRNRYDENLVQAFISVGIELWLIENVSSGERVAVNRAEYERVFGEAPPDELTPVAPDRTPARPTPPMPFRALVDTELANAIPMTEEEIAAQIELQQDRSPNRQPLTEADRGNWKLVRQIVSSDRLLALKSGEALLYGLAQDVVANDEELRTYFGASTLTRYDSSWSEGLVRLLISPWIRWLLVAIVIIGLFLELAAPGVGVFGTVGLLALMLLIGAPLLAGMAQWWDVLLITAGIVLLAVEVFIVPGLGLPGIAGALCLLAGLVSTFVTADIRTEQGQSELWTGLLATLAGVFTAGVGIWLISRNIHAFPILERLVLREEVGGAGPSSPVPATEPTAVVVGDVGVATTDLRPAGRARFGDRLVDVQSPGRFVEAGTPVRIVTVGRYVIDVEVAEA